MFACIFHGLFVRFCPDTYTAPPRIYADADGDFSVTACDALLVLQHATGKPSLKSPLKRYCNINSDLVINATDALLILQYSVGKIKKFPGENLPYTKEEYNKMLKSLSCNTPATEITDAYKLASDGGMIYDPLSREAKKNGTLNKYDNAKKTTGSLSLSDGAVLEYSIPAEFTAYDMIPVNYTVKKGSENAPLYFEATAAEDAERKNGNKLYDAILPGKVELAFEFLGCTYGTKNVQNRPYNSLDFSSDVTGRKYPNYDYTEPILSGAVTSCDYMWYTFKYTNVGNTILDSDGNGTFCFEPILEKKNESGEYDTYLIPSNIYYRITDTLYPGESGEISFIFSWDRDGKGSVNPPAPGEYRIKILSEIRNETVNPDDYFTVIWGGHVYCTSYFEFLIVDEEQYVKPNDVVNVVKNAPERNRWLHTYEEFMTSYESFLDPEALEKGVSGTLYLQCAPWTETVALKFIQGNTDTIDSVDIPVNVETDSIKIELNTTAQNYIIKEDGTRYPAMAAQCMADMRVNTSLGPNADETLMNELLDMKDSGVNIISTCAAFETDLNPKGSTNDTADANWFLADTVRLLGMKLEGYVTYPYATDRNITKARLISGDTDKFPTGYSLKGVADTVLAKANGVKSVYQFMRWGDNYYVTGTGTVPITAEDSRGWMRIDISNREHISEQDITEFKQYLEKKYGTIEKLNEAWDKNYASFDVIDPLKNTVSDHGAVSFAKSEDPELTEWSTGVNELDIFRTEQRVENYNTLLEEVGDSFNAIMAFRTEGANWTSVVPYDTENQHYRHVYYSQRRCAMIPEILAAAGNIKIHSDYTTLPYTPSEITELTKSSVSLGITPMHLIQMDRMREIAVNKHYGQDYSKEYNLCGENTMGVFISTTRSLFEWYKATYEAGGIPGILWEDYLCDGFTTETQIKEMKFYTQKINEALSTDEGKRWANAETTDAKAAVKNSHGVFSYPPEYIKGIIDKVQSQRDEKN